VAKLRQDTALISELKTQIASQENEIAHRRQQAIQVEDLKAEIAELRERLDQNSRNSHRPPSSDPPSQTQKPKSEPRGRKRGGQPGHHGHSRQLKPVAEVDHIIELRPTSCTQCGHLLMGDDPAPSRHQVSEVPRVQAEVTEYRRHTLRCLACDAENQAAWPAEMSMGSFGPRVQATIGYLTGRLGVSHRDVTEVMAVLHGLEVGLGSVCVIQQQVGDALAEPVTVAQQFVEQQKAQYVDETGWPEGAQQKWLWVNATSDVTVFRVLSGRSTADAKQVINESAKGIVGTDRYGAYNWLEGRRRQICWAHLARDFQAMVDRGGESQKIGQALLKQVKRIFKLWHQLRDGDLSRESFQRAIKPVEERVKKLLEAGIQSEHEKTQRTCQNILKVEESLWTFVRVEGVEPTNNAAERGLRRAVLWRKKSFGTQSTEGSRFVERILSTITTLRQQGRDVLDYLTGACRAALGSQSPSSLVPDSS
jgi:transposase